MIDYSISIGSILTILSIAASGFYILVKQNVTSGMMEKQLEVVQKEISKIAIIITDNAVMQQRMLNIEEDIRDLKRGKGYVSKEISGEYTRSDKIT